MRQCRVSIFTIPDNTPHQKPRVALVQIISSDGYDSGSFTFDPKFAPAIAEAILKAGRSAKAGRKRQTVEIDTTI